MSEKPLLQALQREEPLSRSPFWFMRQAGRYLPEYREIRKQAGDFLSLCYSPALAAEVTLQPIRRFGPDAAILFSDILVVPDALGQRLRYVEGEGPQLDPVRDEAALAKLSLRRTATRLSPIYETVERVRAALPRDVALIGFAGAPWTVAAYMVEGHGGQFFAPRVWAHRDPAGFAKLMDLLIEASIEYLTAQIAAGADALQLFDTWAGLLPENAVRRWCFEPTRAIVEGVRARYPKTPIIGFPKGIGAMIEDYAAATGVDAVGLDTAVSPAWAAKSLSKDVALQGNLDPAAVVAGGDAMLRETEAILEAMSGRRHIFNLGHGLVPETPPEHVEILAKRLRDGRSAA